MAKGDETGRIATIQVQFGGAKPKLYANIAREMEGNNGEKACMGTCEVTIDISAAAVNPLVTLAKAELARIAADEKGDPRAKLFKDIPIS